MSRETWLMIKQSKNFYVNTYRRLGTALFASMLLNVLIGLGIYYTYLNRAEHDFYASSGITPPIQLTALDSPNYTSQPLLPPDMVEVENNKALPA